MSIWREETGDNAWLLLEEIVPNVIFMSWGGQRGGAAPLLLTSALGDGSNAEDEEGSLRSFQDIPEKQGIP